VASYAKIIEAGFYKALLKTNLDSCKIQKVDCGLYRLSDGASLHLTKKNIGTEKRIFCQ